MAHREDIAVVVCCHYDGGGQSLLQLHGALDESLQSRGFLGKIVKVETEFGVERDEKSLARIAVDRVADRRTLLDTYNADLVTEGVTTRTTKHTVLVFGLRAG